MKNRKPRTTGSSLQFERGHMFGRESGFHGENNIAYDKLIKRLDNNLCLGCGKKVCKCKSKGDIWLGICREHC